MSILEANGTIACAECGKRARADYDQLKAENAKLRKVMEDLEESDRIHRAMLRQDIELKANLKAENAKLRDAIKELVVGTHAEMCADRDMWQCRECAMHHGDESCAVADAMELLGIDMYGEPLGIEVQA